MKHLSFHPDVAIDIKVAYDWYEKELEGLGDNFLSELESGYSSVLNFPTTWAFFKYEFRRYILPRFPFSIIYKETETKIFIIAVMHNKRKPNSWLKRTKKLTP